jgi:hypothetical protein
MFQQALQGYEKTIGMENVTTYSLVLNTIVNLGSLFELYSNIIKAKAMYLKSLFGNKIVFRPNYLRSQKLRDKISSLNIMIRNKAR